MASNYSSLPLCVAVSCDYGDSDSNQLIKDITKLPEKPKTEDGTVLWSFETKYYTCSIQFTSVTDLIHGSPEDIEALLLQFNPNKEESWSSVLSWWSRLEHVDPSVKLLICEVCDDNSKISRLDIQQWCTDNAFELIELNPDADSIDEFDAYGIQRILQVLHAHTWPNLVMKDKPDTVSPYMQQLINETRVETENQKNNQQDAKTEVEREFGVTADELMDAFTGEGEDGVESFERLFSQLKLMKERAEGMNLEDRKSYAEKVALSFYKAMGGSDDESD